MSLIYIYEPNCITKFTAVVVFDEITGQASSENAKAVGMLAETMAKTGWRLACKETGSNNGGGDLGGAKPGDVTKRMYCTSTHADIKGKS